MTRKGSLSRGEGGLCLGKSVQGEGVSVWGSLSRGVCLGGVSVRGILSGGLCSGGSVRETLLDRDPPVR